MAPDPDGAQRDRSDSGGSKQPVSRPFSRDDVARFIGRNYTSLRKLVRTYLRPFRRDDDLEEHPRDQRSHQPVFDSKDAMESVWRRMDALAAQGKIDPGATDADLLALATIVTQNTAREKARLIARARALEDHDTPYAIRLVERLEKCPDDNAVQAEMERLFLTIANSDDRVLFLIIMRGASQKVAADHLHISHALCRKRWTELKWELAERMRGWEEQAED